VSCKIARAVAAVREDQRADYLYDTKKVSAGLNMHPNKFNQRWYRTRDWLIELYMLDPGATAAELLAIVAMGEAERQRRAEVAAIHPRRNADDYRRLDTTAGSARSRA
jgi:hypothetical protein